MTRWAAGLLSCAVALALVVVSPQVGGQQKAPAARPRGVAPRRPRDVLRTALRRPVRGLSWRQRAH